MPLNLECNYLSLFSAVPFLLAGYAAYYYAGKIETKSFRLERLQVTTGNTKSANENSDKQTYKILHLSDTHLYYPESDKVDFLKAITADDYDFVFLTGDVFEDLSGLPYASALLSRQPKFGAYAILGNHDYYDYTLFHRTIGHLIRKYHQPYEKRDVRPIKEALERIGYKVMSNDSHTIPEQKIHILGIDYPGIADGELFRLAKEVSSEYLKLAIMHLPRKLDSIRRAGVHMTFAGHTHGGQVRLPIIGPLTSNSELPLSEASGLIWRGNSAFHISRGLGADPHLNFRLLCPPAATIIELTHVNHKPCPPLLSLLF